MEYGTIKPIEITQEMRSAYLDYAMSVIVARALPDVRDGLKPVQRRIVYVMHQLGLQHTAPYKKSARIVGDTLGRYHPHGDAAVYEAMVRMAQDFTMRYPLVDGQGNFGSVDGDSPAAQRYTEARLSAIAEELLLDIEKETVDFAPNFDGTLEEPTVLPAAMPNLLLNGAAGIAVGMATNIPPHNLGELCAAISVLIENPEAGVEDLMRVLPGPDFPTGGIILGQEGIRSAYSTGKGHFVVRAKAHIEEATRGRYNIIVSELPYQVNKARLLERIADLVKQDRLSDISDLRDESDRTGMRVVITLKREAQPETVLSQLFKYTQMQVTFGVNLLALVDGTQPRVLTLKRILQHYITYRQEVIIRRTRYELDKARHRAHVLEGLKIALDYLDEVIATIRRSQTAETAKVNLIRRFKLSEIQAQAILDLQLRRLAALERKKIEEEYEQVLRRIAELEDILAHPRKVLDLIQADMQALRDEYGDSRSTRITGEEAGEITAQDLIPDIEVLVALTERGYIKRLPLAAYRRQRRGRTREQDAVRHALAANTKDDLLLFSDRGKCYQLKGHQLPDAERDARGLPLSNLVSVEAQERIVGLVPVPDFEAAAYAVMVTRNGRSKRTSLSEFRAVRSSGSAAALLEEGDALVGAQLAQGSEDVLLVTAKGQALRFSQGELRPMGRNATGVKAIALGAGDTIVGMDLCRWPEAALVTVSGDGYGKRSALDEYPVQGRGGKGVITAKAGQKLAGAALVRSEDEVTIISARGVVVRMLGKEVPAMGRATRGSRVVEVDSGDQVTAVVVLQEVSLPQLSPPPPTAAPVRGEGEKAAAKKRQPAVEAPTRRKKAPARQPAARPKEPAARKKTAERPAAPAGKAEPPARKEAAPGPPARKKPAPAAALAESGRKAAPKQAAPRTAAAATAPKGTAPAAEPAPARRQKAPGGPTPAPRKRSPAAATTKAAPAPRGRQLTLEEAARPAPAGPKEPLEEEGPPLVIRRMGRVVYPAPAEEEQPPAPKKAAAPAARQVEEKPRASKKAQPAPPARRPELIIRQLDRDPGTGPLEPVKSPAAPARRKKEAAGPRKAPAPAAAARKKPAAAPRKEAAPSRAAKKPAPRQRTDVGVSPILSRPAPAKAPSRHRKAEPAPARGKKKPAAGQVTTGKKPAGAKKPTGPARRRPAAKKGSYTGTPGPVKARVEPGGKKKGRR
jgi:DNA gyrase subunit A